MSFICLPSFQHERFLKSHWRRNELGPQQSCQEWKRRSEQRQGSDLPSCCLERLPSSSSKGALLRSHLTALGSRAGGQEPPGYSGLLASHPSWWAEFDQTQPVCHCQSPALLQDSSQPGSKVMLGFPATTSLITTVRGMLPSTPPQLAINSHLIFFLKSISWGI